MWYVDGTVKPLKSFSLPFVRKENDHCHSSGKELAPVSLHLLPVKQLSRLESIGYFRGWKLKQGRIIRNVEQANKEAKK